MSITPTSRSIDRADGDGDGFAPSADSLFPHSSQPSSFQTPPPLSSSSLHSFDEAHAALSEGFGGPLAIPADVLLLWSALGLDAGKPLKVAAALSAFLDASTVPGALNPSISSSSSSAFASSSTPRGPVLGPDQFEAAARMLLCEALIKEARSPAAARAWVAAGGAARALPASRAAALAAEVEAAASAAEASESLAGEMVERSVVFSRRGASGSGEKKVEEKQRASSTSLAAAPAAAAPIDASAALLPAGSKGSTVALGAGCGGVVLRSASFIASTPDRLAELWSSGSGGSGEAMEEEATTSTQRQQRWPKINNPSSSSSFPIPPSLYSVQAAAAAALGAVVAYAAFAERRSLARAGRSGLRALASTFGLALRAT